MACEWQSSLSYAFRLLCQGASKHPPAHTRPAGRVGTPARASSSALSDNPTRDFACSTPRRRGPPPPLPHRRADLPTKGNRATGPAGTDPAQKAVQVHPCACGEKHVMYDVWERQGGSLPHMRGKATGTVRFVAGLGFTPAHAGKSRWSHCS